MYWPLFFFIGFAAGLRSLTPPAVVAWAAHLGWLTLPGALDFMGSTAAVAIFTVLALGEWVADKWWARIPNRTSIPALVARILTGGLAGACIAVAAGESLWLGAVLGKIGGIVGAFSGFYVRRHLTQGLRLPDLPVALVEDAIAIGGCLLIVTRFSQG